MKFRYNESKNKDLIERYVIDFDELIDKINNIFFLKTLYPSRKATKKYITEIS